jgi:hypothetical protein
MPSRHVLLARPHAFIVAEMQPFLEFAGYEPLKLEALADIPYLDARTIRGVVISTAVVSSIPESAETVFAAVRAHLPRVPVVFAGLTEFDLAMNAVRRIVSALHPAAEVHPSTEATLGDRGLGRSDRFVVLGKDDLGTPARSETATRIIRQHFQ